MKLKYLVIQFIAAALLSAGFFSLQAQNSLYLVGTITGESSELAVRAPQSIGDVNGDGYDDFMLTRKTSVELDPTVVDLYFGSPDYDLNPDIIFHFPGNDYYHYLNGGYGIGDVNNDGYDDFILSSSIGPITSSKVYLYYGGETIDTIPVFEFIPIYAYERFGSIERLGDLNNDGYDDFGISSFNWDTYKGNVYLLWGGDSISWENRLTLSSDTTEDFFGITMANIGDINNDDYDDIAVGARDAVTGTGTGKVYIYFGGQDMDNIPDTTLVAEENEFGRIIKNAGDLNSDGNTDFCIAADNKIRIYTSQLENPLEIEGYSIDGNGDINKDGYDDLIVGDDWKVKIYLGAGSFDTASDMSIDDLDSAGFTVNISFAGDINNDGYDEIFAFAYYFPEPDLGKLYIYSYVKPDGIDELNSKYPGSLQLSQNFPNPFNPATTINYQLPQAGFVSLKVYDVLGREVAVLVTEEKPAGRYTVNFDAPDLASGIYLYQLKAGDFIQTKKMILLR